jgi:hypothetical protein
MAELACESAPAEARALLCATDLASARGDLASARGDLAARQRTAE